ncbi:hypothetical protein ACWED2_27510 [Amycolatopsis sp. NPDC005003]
MIEQNPDLLGDLVEIAPARFEALVTDAIAEVTGQPAAPASRRRCSVCRSG